MKESQPNSENIRTKKELKRNKDGYYEMTEPEALIFSREDAVAWERTQILTLGTYLKNKTNTLSLQDLYNEFMELEQPYTLNELLTFGNENGLLDNYDMEEESLKTYCKKNNIRIVR